MSLFAELLECGHGPIADMAMKCEAVLSTHSLALVSVSGGADSDVMLDLVERVRTVAPCEVCYAFFDTGMEYRAAKEHIAWLESRYGVEISRVRARKSIPVACREFGVPFLSKHVSEMVERMQRVGFDWRDGTTDELAAAYPDSVSAMKWWTNANTRTGEPGWFDIGSITWLKEFMLEHPPTFAVSSRCCEWVKKRPSRELERDIGADVRLVGVRRAEGGVRAAHATCFHARDGVDLYKPLFWLGDTDRAAYERMFGIEHSDCYALWGFRRTGCVGCPFNSRCLSEVAAVERYEPTLARAARKVFADSYAYTALWHDYRDWRRCGMHRLF